MNRYVSVLIFLFSVNLTAEPAPGLFDAQGNVDGEVFYTALISELNSNIKEINRKNVNTGGEKICSEVSAEAKETLLEIVSYVSTDRTVKYYNMKNVRVEWLIHEIATSLVCHPLPCDEQKRKSIVGTICNAPAYNRDLNLVGSAMDSIFDFDLLWGHKLSYNVKRRAKGKN